MPDRAGRSWDRAGFPMGQVDGFAFGEGRPRLRPGLRVTHLGDERLVLDPAAGVVHTVRGAAARALDKVLAGRPELDEQILAPLAAVGIVSVQGISRRTALLAAGSAMAMIASTSLPSAIAAASTVGVSVSGSGGELLSYSMQDGSTIYSLVHSSSSSSTITRNLIIGSSAKKVELLLVGSGGTGGEGATAFSADAYGGGGGGGEVVFVTLDSVGPSTNFKLVVAGRNFSGGGQDTIVSYDVSGTEVARARGGGAGASAASSAGDGGSGGGGSSEAPYTSRGSSTAAVTAYGSDGAAGAAGTSGGGGGAGGVAPTTGTSTVGGSGGSALAISSFFDLTVPDGEAAVAGQLALGGGGGGAGAVTGGSAGSGASQGAGASSGLSGDATLGSGGGGGGGFSRFEASGASASLGATGAVWIRLSDPDPA